MKKFKTSAKTVNLSSGIDPLIVIQKSIVDAKREYWLWGSDNLLPNTLATMNRRTSIQRALLNSKTTYCTGKNITTGKDDSVLKNLNVYGQSLRDITSQLMFDRFSLGNQFTEVVRDKKGKFQFIYRHDPLTCRLGKGEKEGLVLLLSDWNNYDKKKKKVKELPIYPEFIAEGNYLRSMVHIKELEQGFNNYGVPSYIAGLQASAITYKTDKWNLSRLDNSFNSSAIITVEDDFDSDKEAEDLKNAITGAYTGEGTAGTVTVITKGINDGKTTVEQLESSNEGEWQNLHGVAKDDLVIAHQWFRSLIGMADNTGFDTKRILNEYEVALSTVISKIQEDYVELYQKLFQNYFDVSELKFENKPPVTIMTLLDPNLFVKKGEARRMAGLEVDETDPTMNEYIKKESTKTTE